MLAGKCQAVPRGMGTNLVITLIFASSALFLPLCILGQVGTAGISGTVFDQAGAVVPNVKITVKNEATNLDWSATTGAAGSYFIRDLPPGIYTISAQAQGFSKFVVENVVTEIDKVSSVDVKLSLGEVKQT